MSNNKQSSVRWAIEELTRFELGTSEFFSKTAIINHADRLHKEEIVNAHIHGHNAPSSTVKMYDAEQYYNEEYGGNK